MYRSEYFLRESEVKTVADQTCCGAFAFKLKRILSVPDKSLVPVVWTELHLQVGPQSQLLRDRRGEDPIRNLCSVHVQVGPNPRLLDLFKPTKLTLCPAASSFLCPLSESRSKNQQKRSYSVGSTSTPTCTFSGDPNGTRRTERVAGCLLTKCYWTSRKHFLFSWFVMILFVCLSKTIVTCQTQHSVGESLEICLTVKRQNASSGFQSRHCWVKLLNAKFLLWSTRLEILSELKGLCLKS